MIREAGHGAGISPLSRIPHQGHSVSLMMRRGARGRRLLPLPMRTKNLLPAAANNRSKGMTASRLMAVINAAPSIDKSGLRYCRCRSSFAPIPDLQSYRFDGPDRMVSRLAKQSNPFAHRGRSMVIGGQRGFVPASPSLKKLTLQVASHLGRRCAAIRNCCPSARLDVASSQARRSPTARASSPLSPAHPKPYRPMTAPLTG